MILARTPRLVIRNWIDTDRDLFFEINSDLQVMEFFSARRSRKDADAFMDVVRETVATTGYGFFALALADTDEPIGFCGLALAKLAPILPAETVEIGWRLAHRHWSKGYVTEAAQALLHLGFAERDLDEIVAFAVPANRRSTKVMERIGMTRDPTGDFDHPRVADTHPHLRRHVLYRLRRTDWAP